MAERALPSGVRLEALGDDAFLVDSSLIDWPEVFSGTWTFRGQGLTGSRFCARRLAAYSAGDGIGSFSAKALHGEAGNRGAGGLVWLRECASSRGRRADGGR